ncbi:MAG: ATP-binding protein [Candidatus Omnitrophica bacterium]|nr:ATP-binding protein [Candidatus Omnitrophota bacterium]
MIKSSFKLKLIFSYFFLIFASLGFIAFFLDRHIEEKTLQGIESALLNEARLIENQVSVPSALNNPPYLDKLCKDLGLRIGSRITVINLEGKVLADSEVPFQQVPGMENHLGRPEVSEVLQGRIGREIRYSSTLKIDMLYMAVPIEKNNVRAGILRLALPLTSVQKVLSAARKTIIVGLLFTLGLAFVLASILAKALIRPINRIIYASSRFAKGDFSRRIFHQGSHDEIGRLAATLNNMAQEIEYKIREVATKNQHLEAIFNSMIEGVIVTDRSSKVISVNRAIEELFGISRAQVEGKFFQEGIRNSGISELIAEAMSSARFISKEVTLVMPPQKILQANVSPLFDQEKVGGSLTVIHDITEIRRLETVRRDFVANVSHELKTPLTSIKGFVETLLEGALDDKENSVDFLRIINNHTDRLNALVDDLLELSHMESKEMSLSKTKFSLAPLVKEVMTVFGSQAKKKKVELSFELPQGLEIFADKDKIEQVLVNLVNNAIKYNKENGFVKVYSGQSKDGTKIVVEDSGSGIPAKDIPRIFERFYRVDKARSRELGGTGLGLSIVKHIIELHSGSVGVESTEGLGSKFFFIIPASSI